MPEPILYWIDFHGVAGLIDTVAGAAPERLGKLLHLLSSSQEQLEARVVVELALRCRDPLSPLATLCRDALETAADLDTLLNAEPWRHVQEVCRHPRAGALLNLCEAALASPTPYNERRLKRIREIRPRVRRAAAAEMISRRQEIERVRGMRSAVLPDLWVLLGGFVEKTKKTMRRAAFHRPRSPAR
ncbi:MAG: hypothetical protein GY719_42440 [bacterium]|nr:hypothetical protein [bacterium]